MGRKPKDLDLFVDAISRGDVDALRDMIVQDSGIIARHETSSDEPEPVVRALCSSCDLQHRKDLLELLCIHGARLSPDSLVCLIGDASADHPEEMLKILFKHANSRNIKLIGDVRGLAYVVQNILRVNNSEFVRVAMEEYTSSCKDPEESRLAWESSVQSMLIGEVVPDGLLIWMLNTGHVNVNAAPTSDMPLIHTAAARGNLNACKILYERGADPSALGGIDRANALFWAASEGRADVVQWILTLHDSSAWINVKDASGCTSLHVAMETYGAEQVANLLIEHGGDLSITNDEGLTPADCAADRGLKIENGRVIAGHPGRRR